MTNQISKNKTLIVIALIFAAIILCFCMAFMFGKKSGVKKATFDVEIEYANLIIKHGEDFNIEKSDLDIVSEIYTEEESGIVCIRIQEPDRKYDDLTASSITVYVPEDYVFEKMKIQSGVGSINSESITAKNIELNLGTGKTEFTNLVVTESAKIRCGLGTVKIEGGKIFNLDFESGVGTTEIKAELCGKNSLTLGIGATSINIIGNKSEYTLEATKGMGKITVDNTEVEKNSTIGDGENYIKIKGGIGITEIRFSESENHQD